MTTLSKEKLKEDLIAKGLYQFPKIDYKNLTKWEWGCVLEALVNGTSRYVCDAIKSFTGMDCSFIEDALEDTSEVTCWYFDTTGIWLDSLYSTSADNFYRILWVEYILEHYND